MTSAPEARAGAIAWNKGSTRAVPVKCSAAPCLEDCDAFLQILIVSPSVRTWACETLHNIPRAITVATNTLLLPLICLPLSHYQRVFGASSERHPFRSRTKNRAGRANSGVVSQVFENWPVPCKNTSGSGLRSRRASPIRWPTASHPDALSRGPESRRPSHRDGIRRSNPCPDRNAAKPASPHHSDRRSWRS